MASRFSGFFAPIRHLTWRGWALIFGIVALLGIVFGFFFVRRPVIEYRQEHRFSVQDPAFFGSAHALSDPLPIAGNKIELLHNGDQIFPAMLTAIAAATKTVNFEAFLFNSGEVGSKFRDTLSERALAGLRVRVLLDGVGSGSSLDDSDVKAMEDAGCQVSYYHPTRSWRLDRTNRRTHRRILVVDGRIGFTGGVGFADEWRGNADAPKHWRDIHARIEGPLVAKLQAAFQQHWVSERKEALGGADDFPELKPAGNLTCQVVASTAFSTAPIPLLQAVTFSSAREKIWIANAYCIPTDDQVELLGKAAARGVDVRMLVPGKQNDQPATKAGGRSAFGGLLKAGVKIFEYKPTMFHGKTMVADGIFSMFGSSNFDSRSTSINEELDVTVYDKGFAQEMERVFEKDQLQARPYTLADYEKRSLWERLSEWAVLPFRSQL